MQRVVLIGLIFFSSLSRGVLATPFVPAEDTTRMFHAIGRGKSFIEGSKPNYDSARYFFNTAAQIAKAGGDELNYHKSLTYLGYTAIQIGDKKEGEQHFRKAIQYYESIGEPELQAQTWILFGEAYAMKDNLWPQVKDSKNFNDMISCFRNGVRLTDETQHPKLRLARELTLAEYFMRHGDLDSAETKYQSVLARNANADSVILQTALIGMVPVSYFKGNLNKALYYGLQSLKIPTDWVDANRLSELHLYLGNSYRDLGMRQKALEHYHQSLAYCEQVSAFEYLYGSLTRNIARIMISSGEAKQALAFITDQMHKHPADNPMLKMLVNESLGYCYAALGDPAMAEKYFLKTIEYSKAVNHATLSLPQYYSVGKFYYDNNQLEKARKYLNPIEKAPMGLVALAPLCNTHFMLFKIDSAAHNYVSAIKHLRMHKALNDSIFNASKFRQIEELQVQYETEKKEQDIQLLENQNKFQVSELEKAAFTRNVIIAGTIMMAILLALSFNRYRIKQKANEALATKQGIINEKNISLEKMVDEKEWLLKEIHHRVKNNLQVVVSLLNTQSTYIKNEDALMAIKHSQYRMYAMSLIHQKLYESASLSKINLSSYVNELIDYLKDSFDTGKRIRFDLSLEPVELSISQSLPVGLILSETITNSIKYAFPNFSEGTVGIVLNLLPNNQIRLVINDNGIGLPTNFDISKSNTLGLELIKGLSRQLGAVMSMESKGGLRVSLEWYQDAA